MSCISVQLRTNDLLFCLDGEDKTFSHVSNIRRFRIFPFTVLTKYELIIIHSIQTFVLVFAEMNSSAFVVTLIGTVAAGLVVSINLFLMYTTRKKRKDIVLFYFRFFIDVIFGLSYFLYSLLILGFVIYRESFFMENSNFFWFGLPFSNASAARTFLVLIIVLDRFLATYYPIKYHIVRPRIPNYTLYALPILFSCTEDVVILAICGKNSKPTPKNCFSFPCTLNACGYDWWTSYKNIIFPIIIILTMLLFVKLVAFSKRLQISAVTKKANRLALLNAFLIFFFDFVPMFLAHEFPNSPLIAFTSTGPVTAMLKQIGRVIESLIVVEILVIRKPKVDESRRSKEYHN